MSIRLIGGDCREVLATLPANSVHMVCTSPPYYGLRDYGTAQWDGGDAACDHRVWGHAAGKPTPGGRGGSMPAQEVVQRERCGKCGATRVDRQIGLEATPDAYLAEMVAVFREVKRVLRPDGTCWVNLGSSYASGGKSANPSRQLPRESAYGSGGIGSSGSRAPGFAYPGQCDGPQADSPSHHARSFHSALFEQPGPPPAEMINHDSEHQASPGVSPWLPDAPASTILSSPANGQGAFGLTATASADRSAPPTYAGDALASAHTAQSNPDTSSTDEPLVSRRQGKGLSSRACDCGSCGICWAYLATPLLKFKAKDLMMMPALLALALQADGWYVRSDIIWAKPNPMPESTVDRPTSAHEHVFLLAKNARYYYDADAVREVSISDHPSGNGYKRDARLSYTDKNGARGNDEHWPMQTNRNCRNVWTIATAPFSQSHFATMPPAVVERCVRAGTSERGCCAACGAPWGRITDTAYERNRAGHSGRTDASGSNGWDGGNYPNLRKISTTTGWSPSCACGADTVPCTVLDPFAGAGTTLLVADRLQRDAIGIELNPDYTRMAMDRCRDDAPLFASPPPAESPEEPRIRDLFAEPVK